MNRLSSLFRSTTRRTVAAMTFLALAAAAPAQQPPVLPPGCEAVAVPAGHAVSLRLFAQGFQIYQWDATNSRWAFVGPAAILYPDAGIRLPVGVHYTGPTWTILGGSSVTGALAASCVVDPTAIPWLRLQATPAPNPGPLAGTTWIQRVHTTGGRAPAQAGTGTQQIYVPYTADYYFYRAR